MFQGLKNTSQELETQKQGATRSIGIHSSALGEVEQRREVEFQVEEVHQIQKPAHFQALKFAGVHKDIKNFLISGVLPRIDCYEQQNWVKNDTNDSFLRPVGFILWSHKTETALIVIPEEAEALIPLAPGPGKMATHLII
ncbi:hypothetical protein K432DRAFT_409689 [Lepidopterella palustris CBS 459.81]|uniref:Uncharacterized protein n=1 Tax=Lepidopterella palustris CBS 459.81 TaxID=1314670 RepID=A0A8E2DZR4_9PEZI|nr:hypothetical protein K432DRAFT_409689 [Lepidopterella palustris CBS 459.81]